MIKLKTPIPVTLLTGFLGSGKTTLLNQLIRLLPHTAIVMNEFGEIGLDHQLLEKTDGPLALLAGGCVCCTVKGSLSPTLKNLFMSASNGSIPAFERVIVETTGVADPTPIIETLINDRWVAARFQLQGVVTTIDAVLGEQQLDSYEESLKQVAVADRLILTKTDLAKPDQIDTLIARIKTINQSAPMISVVKGAIDPAEIFHASAYNPEGNTVEVKSWVSEARFTPASHGALVAAKPATHSPHNDRIQSYSIYRDEPLEWDALYAALKKMVNFSPKHILRVKGLINLKGKNIPTVVHGVQHVLYPPVELAEWPDEDHRSRLVMITYDMDPAIAQKLIDELWLD